MLGIYSDSEKCQYIQLYASDCNIKKYSNIYLVLKFI